MKSQPDPLEAMACRIFQAAINEERCAELLECLFEGGSVTVDLSTNRLILAPKEMWEGMRS